MKKELDNSLKLNILSVVVMICLKPKKNENFTLMEFFLMNLVSKFENIYETNQLEKDLLATLI